jgi:predicted dehydrogenase
MTTTTEINVALVGSKFMVRAQSNAWLNVAKFFDVNPAPVMHTVVGRNATELDRFARRWGWQHPRTDWEAAITAPEIGLVDVATPNDVHAEQSIAALEAGKHVVCEKPLAGTLADAQAMAAAAAAAPGMTFVWYNYRRTPAVALAHRLVRSGALGRIYHARACYLQSWGGPSTPLVWRFQAEVAGSGAHGDLNAHIIDAVRFVTGEEIVSVEGAIEHTFIAERELPDGAGSEIAGSGASGSGRTGPSTVDDAVMFIGRLSGGGLASFEASRLAAPELLDAEVLAVLRREVLTGRLKRVRAEQALDDLTSWGVQRVAHRALLRDAWKLRAHVSAYDALYVAVAQAFGAPLVTADGPLSRAPKLGIVVHNIRLA